MAIGKGGLEGAAGRLVTWLAGPLGITFLLLLAVGIGAGQLAWLWVANTKVISWASGMLSPFCMICATAIWAMRNRMDDLVDTEVMTSEVYATFQQLAIQQRRRSTICAGMIAMMALLASGPAVSIQLAGAVWHWMLLLAGSAVAASIFGYMIANHWEQQIWAYRSEQKLKRKQAQEREALASVLRASTKPADERMDWAKGPEFELKRCGH